MAKKHKKALKIEGGDRLGAGRGVLKREKAGLKTRLSVK